MNDTILLATSALPYANGHLHIGHILEFIQTDIWVKYNKLLNKKCFYISGIDAHGTPVMLKSLIKSVSFENLVNNYILSHKFDLVNFNISVDTYYTTHSYENELFSRKFFRKLYEKEYLFIKKVNRFYDIQYKIFLPDRYVIGTCSNCKSKNQYADICNSCNYKSETNYLLNPISVLSNSEPIKKDTEHFFFDLNKFKDFLFNWCFENISQKTVFNKLKEWLIYELKEWDISRDYPYFGFKVPGESKKFFYVWLDAPISYISNFFNFLLNNDLIYLKDFSTLKTSDLHHFIGKDIIYFHALFWPAMLKGVRFKLFKDLHVHGFLTINGLKMSKSDNVFIHAKTICKQIDVDFLRFYFASKIGLNVTDIDFKFDDFIDKINSDLVGKFFNIFSRCAKIIINNCNSLLSSNLDNPSLFYEYLNIKNIISPFYYSCDYSKVVFYIFKYVDKINFYLDSEKPWKLIKSKKTFQKAHDVCTTAINLFFILLLNLKPIMPNLSIKIEKFFGFDNLSFINFNEPLFNINISNYKHIISRIKI